MEDWPHNFPPKSTAWDCSSLWSRDGVLDHIGRVLRESIRIHANRDAVPSTGIIDSQNVKTTQASEAVGYDAGKKTQGRKRHMVVDILGLLLGVKDYEYSTRSSEAWVKITSINMMIHRLEPG